MVRLPPAQRLPSALHLLPRPAPQKILAPNEPHLASLVAPNVATAALARPTPFPTDQRFQEEYQAFLRSHEDTEKNRLFAAVANGVEERPEEQVAMREVGDVAMREIKEVEESRGKEELVGKLEEDSLEGIRILRRFQVGRKSRGERIRRFAVDSKTQSLFCGSSDPQPLEYGEIAG